MACAAGAEVSDEGFGEGDWAEEVCLELESDIVHPAGGVQYYQRVCGVT